MGGLMVDGDDNDEISPPRTPTARRGSRTGYTARGVIMTITRGARADDDKI